MIFSDHNIIIADCSFYQDDDLTPQKIDFAKMKSNGVAGVILRGGQNNWIDEDFRDYWVSAKQAGLPRGSYWFYDSRTEPTKQAQLWRRAIGNDLPEIGLWTDLEESYGGTYKGEKNWKIFVNTIESLLPNTVSGIYTANWWWTSQTVSDPSFWGRRPLWVAQYTTNPVEVILPYPWRDSKAHLWQYTSKGDGLSYGVESLNIDLNKWNGTKEEFDLYFGINSPIPPGETMSYKITPDFTIGSKIRKDHSASSTQIGSLSYGKYGYGVERWGDGIIEDWIHITEYENNQGGRTVLDGWVASRNGGSKYATITVVAEPPPPPPPPSTLPTLLIEVSDTEGLYTPVSVELKPK